MAAALPTPYDLIYRWTAYMPLDDILAASCYGFCVSEENGDGTSTTIWVPHDRDYDVRVPTELIQETRRYLRPTLMRENWTWPPISNRAFIDENEDPITAVMFRDKVGKALSEIFRRKSAS